MELSQLWDSTSYVFQPEEQTKRPLWSMPSFLDLIPITQLKMLSGKKSELSLEASAWQGWAPIKTEQTEKKPEIGPVLSTNYAITRKFTDGRQDWINLILSAYKKAGVSDRYAKMLIALDAGETDWGRKAVGTHNYGNITVGSWKGPSKSAKDSRGKTYKYRSYTSADAYVLDKLKLLRESYDITGGESMDEFVHKLQGGNPQGNRYAEAANYKEYLQSMFNSL